LRRDVREISYFIQCFAIVTAICAVQFRSFLAIRRCGLAHV
jgi:hypothetical protein